MNLATDNFYRILKSSKNSKTFENFFKFKNIKIIVSSNFPSKYVRDKYVL